VRFVAYPFAETAKRLLEEDPRIAVVLADISADLFVTAAARHPQRVINLGIREQLLVSVAGGLALSGMRPIAHTYAPFLVSRPFEQIKLDLGHQGVGAILVSVGASYDAAGVGRTHHAPEDVALIDTQEDWTVHVPGHAGEVAELMRNAARRDDRTYVRLSTRSNAEAHPGGAGGVTVVRGGTLGAVVAVGPMLDPVLAAVEGLDITVLYANTVRPFPSDTLRSTLTAPDVVLVEPYLEGTSTHVVGDALADIPHRLLALGVGHRETRSYGTVEDHDRIHGLDPRSLRSRIEGFLGWN
jgi:transketolase